MAESTRDRLINAALDLFSEKGYYATSVDEIAESIGIKGPNIYKYFKGKQALFDAIATEAVAAYTERMGLNTSSDLSRRVRSGSDLKAFTMSQVNFTINDERIHKMRKLLSIEQFKDEGMRNHANFFMYDNMNNLYTKIFVSLIKEGVIKDENPNMLALNYTSPISILIQISDRSPDQREEIIDLIRDHIDFFLSNYCIKY